MAVKTLTRQVEEILLREWDPIGIADEPAAQDEYDAYVAPIVRLIQSGASAKALAEHLVGIERDQMALAGDRARAMRAAVKLAVLQRT